MSDTVQDASEKAFQENFVRELEKYKWEAPDYLNGNTHKVTVDDLVANWRYELNRINADQLEGVELTDGEFRQIMSKVGQISNSFEAARLLSMEKREGKIDGIYRDDDPRITRKQITLKIFKKAEVSGGDSSYKIAREIQTSHDNRFDIVLLINGLPLINIEQKRTDKTLDDAFGQFIRYYRDGEYCNNFMAFSQMMVITTEIETRYFATPMSIKDFNPVFTFHWADEKNHIINDWKGVVDNFLRIPMAHQMVGDYSVIEDEPNAEDRNFLLMRPYQIYALRAVEGATFGWDNDGIAHGGFVWHTTGSGKTITSFKTALFLSTRAGLDKVVFLVDRRELDSNTSDRFKAFAKYEQITVDDTKHTYQLGKLMEAKDNGIIVTTTFKLNSLVKDRIESGNKGLSQKKIVFIIDEAHRTTMGQMMGTIRSYFGSNSLFFGFTGTPLFEENNVRGKVNEKSEVINTTEKLFGPLLHSYTIDQAISDGNVLAFHVDYINTGEFKSYDDLRDQLIERMENEHPEEKERDIEKRVAGLSIAEVEEEAKNRDILVYNDKTHIPSVVETILDNWDEQSQGRTFNGILTVAYKDRVLAYYHEFDTQMKEKGIKLNVAMTFSFGDINDPENVSIEVIKEMFKDYSKFTGVEYIAGDKIHGEQAYFADVTDRAKKGGSSRNPKNIDLIIVADQLLTGYDSKLLNTLYVDRRLELQGLVQAYSRTNRVYGKSKEFGSIINFQYPALTEKQVDEALTLYGSGGNNSRAIVDKYDVAVEKFNIDVSDMVETLTDPSKWASFKSDVNAEKAFIEAYKCAEKQYRLVTQYYEYEWNDATFGIDEHTWLMYVGAYKNLCDIPVVTVDPDDRPLVGRTKLVGTQVIDAAHILKLIGARTDKTTKTQTVDDETLRIIYEQLKELSNMGENRKANLMRSFIDTELVPGKVSADIDFDVAYDQWKEEKVIDRVNDVAAEYGIDKDVLRKSFSEFSISDTDSIPYIDDVTKSVSYELASNKSAGNRLMHIIQMTKKLPEEFAEIKTEFA